MGIRYQKKFSWLQKKPTIKARIWLYLIALNVISIAIAIGILLFLSQAGQIATATVSQSTAPEALGLSTENYLINIEDIQDLHLLSKSGLDLNIYKYADLDGFREVLELDYLNLDAPPISQIAINNRNEIYFVDQNININEVKLFDSKDFGTIFSTSKEIESLLWSEQGLLILTSSPGADDNQRLEVHLYDNDGKINRLFAFASSQDYFLEQSPFTSSIFLSPSIGYQGNCYKLIIDSLEFLDDDCKSLTEYPTEDIDIQRIYLDEAADSEGDQDENEVEDEDEIADKIESYPESEDTNYYEQIVWIDQELRNQEEEEGKSALQASSAETVVFESELGQDLQILHSRFPYFYLLVEEGAQATELWQIQLTNQDDFVIIERYQFPENVDVGFARYLSRLDILSFHMSHQERETQEIAVFNLERQQLQYLQLPYCKISENTCEYVILNHE